MTAKELKNALLQEAVQGKLVLQIASEGNARDLLEEIRKEKAKLVKEGKIKKEKEIIEILIEQKKTISLGNDLIYLLSFFLYRNPNSTMIVRISHFSINTIIPFNSCITIYFVIRITR